MKKNLVDDFYNYIEDHYCLGTTEELLGKRYTLGKQKETGNLIRMTIEEGLEISKVHFQENMAFGFDNREVIDDIFEIGYCDKGNLNLQSLPDCQEYKISEGDLFIYKTTDEVQHFKFHCQGCHMIAVHINFDVIKRALHPIMGRELLENWHEYLNTIFKGKVLVIEKASDELKNIANEMNRIAVDDVIGYIKLKQKTIEFLLVYFENIHNNSNFAPK